MTFDYPETDDVDWGAEATDWAAAVTSGMLQKAGGLFQLLAEVDFGTGFGVKSLYFKTRTSNNADSGQYRMARADVISWRNQANSGNLNLSVDSSDNLLFNGVPIVGSFTVDDTDSIDLDLTATVLTANLNLSAAAADSGFINAINTIESDGLQTQIPIADTSTTGVLTSTDWNTFNSKQGSGNYITALTGDVTASGPGSVAATIANLAVTNAKIANATIDLTAKVTGALPILNGGTGQTTKAAAFDALSPMSASGDIIYGGASGTGTRLPKGSDGQSLILSSGVPAWSFPQVPTAVKTSTYAISATDSVVLVDGTSAFTATLPTAVGVAGKTYFIKRVDQTLANAVTIATTSSQTIDGVTTRKLMTQYEDYMVVSDGSNWLVLAHSYPQGATAYTPTVTGVGTATNVSAFWYRYGDRIKAYGIFTCGTVPGGTTLSITLPSGLTISSTKIPTSLLFDIGKITGVIGTASTTWPSNGVAVGGPYIAVADTATNANIIYVGRGTSANTITKMSSDANFVSGNTIEFTVDAPITNWEP